MDLKKNPLAVLAPLALLAALAGVNWGLPGADKAARELPAQWNSPAFFDALTSGWQNIYDKSRGSTPLLAETDGKYTAHLDAPVSIDFGAGLPPAILHNSYRSMLIRSEYADEALPLSDLAQMKPAKLDFRPPSFLYGGGYLYPLGAYYLALSKLGIIQRMSMRRTLENPGSLRMIYAAGRFLSALAFAGVCCLCFLIASRLQGAEAGLFAFIFALTSPLALVHAHYLTPHLWAAFWGLLSVFVVLRALPAPGFRPMIWSGVFMGVSAGSYWSQFHVLIFLAALLLSEGRAFFSRGSLLRTCAMTGAGALTFLLLNPYLPGAWALALREMAPGPAPAQFSYWANLAALVTHTLPATLGLPCALAAAAGCAAGLLSKNAAARALAAACILMFFISGALIPSDLAAGARRFFPWLMLSLAAGGVFVSGLVRRAPGWLKVPLLLLCFVPGALLAGAYEANFLRDASPSSNFAKMGAELDSRKPEGRMGLLELPQPSNAPQFRLDRWPLLLVTPAGLSGLADKDLPEYLLVAFQHKQAALAVLEKKYALAAGFYPRGVPGFSVDPAIGPANRPVELYRRREARS